MMTTSRLLQLAKAAIERTEATDWLADTFLNKETTIRTPATTIENLAGAAIEPAATVANSGVEWHPLIPFLPQQTRILFLGSFPPQRKRWCMDFFYPNFINDHWRIEGLVFHADADYFVDREKKSFRLPEIVAHLKHHGIGFFDTAIAVRRLADNASDKFLEVVEPTDIQAMVQHLPALRAIVTTGEKATVTIAERMNIHDDKDKTILPAVNHAIPSPFLGIELYRLPSSSRAYPMSLSKKAEAYRVMFERYL